MIRISTWKIVLILAVCVFAFAYSAPNFIGKSNQEWLKNNLPGWMPTRTVNLGLDLRGGAHLLYQVDLSVVFDERAEMLVQDLRDQLREQKIGYTRIGASGPNVKITLRDKSGMEEVQKIIRRADSRYIIEMSGEGNILDVKMDEGQIKEIEDQAMSQSIEIVRRRVDELGTTEPTIQRQGENRILLQVPGADAEDLKRLVGKTAKLGFHLLGEPGETKVGELKLPMAKEPEQKLSVKRRASVTGDMLDNAQPTFDQNGRPVVSFRLNAVGARIFCDVTRNNVQKPFAIVLDNEIISAPVINEPICGGQGQISGGFDIQGANDLALLLRAGALPAPMNVIEERSVGPSLGSDSVKAGQKACIMALIFVMSMAVLVYGLFGIFAAIGLLVNVMLILAVMSLLQATLTLPGIAGIVLTIGLAIDANVLIFERIKEELRDGRSILSAIDTGYKRALTTITDSNLTSLIAALILFSFGTGPIKGFAVTMCIGVATSYFCALMLTRLMVLTWLKRVKPKEIKV